MKKFSFLWLLGLLMMVSIALPSCSDDDDSVDTGIVTGDNASAIAGEYSGSIVLSGYTGSIPTIITLTKRNNNMVDMILDSDDADIHTTSMPLNVAVKNGVYTISNSTNTVTGTVAGNSLSLTFAGGDTAMVFSGTRR